MACPTRRSCERCRDGTRGSRSPRRRAIFRGRGLSEVILVSDPYHALRIGGIADELGLTAHVSPTRTSPISGSSELEHMVKETGAVAVGRIIGYRRLLRLEG